MKILFYCPTLNFRGTTNAILKYAEFNETLLGNNSAIAYDKSVTYVEDLGSEVKVLSEVARRFTLIQVDGLSGLEMASRAFDLLYIICPGKLVEPVPRSTKTAYHAVFGEIEPHGGRYAVVSEWLSKRYTGRLIPFVPHVVNLPEPNLNFRKELGVTDNQILIGRIGGFSTFDLGFIREAIREILAETSDFVFALVNTPVFIHHPNVKYIKPFFSEQTKSNFICSCDFLIHARHQGESFGLAICEALYHNKPTIAWAGGQDQAHCELLGPLGLLYYTKNDFKRLLLSTPSVHRNLRESVTQFTPENVMAKFKAVFLD